MEPSTEQMSELTPDQLYDQAVAHYRAARWAESLACLGELVTRGAGSSEIDALVQDIKFKQRLDAAQAPLVAPAPQGQRHKAGIALWLGGAVASLAVIGAGLALVLSQQDATLAMVPPVVQAAVGALPTPAPALPTPAPTAPVIGTGALAVSLTEGDQLSLGGGNVYLILDASGSMLARVGSERKIDLAQQALVGLVEGLPADTNIALRTYGRQRPDDCSDVELMIPMAPLDRAGLITQIEGIEPVNLSRTPIGGSLEAVATDLAAVADETHIVLVSDGEESCEADPVAIAQRLHAAQPNLRVSVVGFDIAPELRDRLARIAEVGGGVYYDASNVGQLAAALETVVAPRFRVLDSAGSEVGAGQLGEQLELPAGAYTVTLGAGSALLEQTVEVRDGMATTVLLDDEDGQLRADVSLDWRP